MNGSVAGLASSGRSTLWLAASELAGSPAESSWLARAGASDALRALTPLSPLAAERALDAVCDEPLFGLDAACGAAAGADWR